MKLLGKMVLAGALSLVSLPAFAHGHHHGRREKCHDRHDRDDDHRQGGWRGEREWRPAPPAVRQQVWVPGHWVRRGGAQVWISASWTLPPQPAWVWVEPQWVWTGARWEWQDAHWAPPS
jgi:hypothetical protein